MVGLDLTDPSIWASGIEALSDDLDEAEALAQRRSVSAEPTNARALASMVKGRLGSSLQYVSLTE